VDGRDPQRSAIAFARFADGDVGWGVVDPGHGLVLARGDGDPAAAAAAAPTGTVALLPAFDQYVVAAPRETSPVLAGEHKARVYRPQGWLSPVLLVDGRIEGVWRHERRGGRLTVVVEPFGNPGEEVRASAEAEVQRLAAFLGGDLDLSWA
jgi:hypothetical protein